MWLLTPALVSAPLPRILKTNVEGTIILFYSNQFIGTVRGASK